MHKRIAKAAAQWFEVVYFPLTLATLVLLHCASHLVEETRMTAQSAGTKNLTRPSITSEAVKQLGAQSNKTASHFAKKTLSFLAL